MSDAARLWLVTRSTYHSRTLKDINFDKCIRKRKEVPSRHPSAPIWCYLRWWSPRVPNWAAERQRRGLHIWHQRGMTTRINERKGKRAGWWISPGRSPMWKRAGKGEKRRYILTKDVLVSRCNDSKAREMYTDDTNNTIRGEKLAKSVEYLPFYCPCKLSLFVSFA